MTYQIQKEQKDRKFSNEYRDTGSVGNCIQVVVKSKLAEGHGHAVDTDLLCDLGFVSWLKLLYS